MPKPEDETRVRHSERKEVPEEPNRRAALLGLGAASVFALLVGAEGIRRLLKTGEGERATKDAGANPETEDIPLPAPSEPAREQFLSRIQRIDYQRDFEKPNERIHKIIKTISQYQEEIINRKGHAPENIRELKQAVWKQLQFSFPNWPEFSEDIFYRTLLEELPEEMAQCGIFVKSLAVPEYNHIRHTLDRIEMFFKFYIVKKVEPRTQNFWAQDVPCDAIRVSEWPEDNRENEASGAKHLSKLFGKKPTQAFYGNVIVYRDHAVQRDFEEAFIQHETGHLALQQKNGYKEKYMPIATDSAPRFVNAFMGSSVHEEIYAFLSELRYSELNDAARKHFVSAATMPTKKDFPHARAADWILKKIQRETEIGIHDMDHKQLHTVIEKIMNHYQQSEQEYNFSREYAMLIE